jgi:hypothetical protein
MSGGLIKIEKQETADVNVVYQGEIAAETSIQLNQQMNSEWFSSCFSPF